VSEKPLTEEELLEQLRKIKVEDVILQTVVTLVNLGGQRLVGEERDLEQAKLAIEAVRALLPLCPEEESKPVKDALSQLQMLFARESQQPTSEGEPKPEAEPKPAPESKIWTPPGSTS
jgi:hypothetical protein